LTTIVIVVLVAHNPAVGVNVYVVVVVLLIAGDQVPVIPFVEAVGKAGITSPEQYGPTAAKVGVTFGLIVIVKFCVVAHSPAVGANVYVVVEVLLIAGDHVPVIPFDEVVDNAPIADPEQYGPTPAKVGVIFGLIVIVKVCVVAHNPAVGVNVYVVVEVLLIAGDHVPVIPFVEVVGNAPIADPEQYGPTATKEGVIFGLTTIVKVCVVAHGPAVGVNVYVVVVVLLIAGDHVPVIPFVEVVGNAPIADPEQ